MLRGRHQAFNHVYVEAFETILMMEKACGSQGACGED
jgi:hypothetical protein